MRKALALLALGGCVAHEWPEEQPASDYHQVAVCPQGTRWDGDNCVWQRVISDVRCPDGAHWTGNHCAADLVVCPEGMRYDGRACAAAAPAPPPEYGTTGTLVATSNEPCMFRVDGAPMDRPSTELRRQLAPGQHVVSCGPRGGTAAENTVVIVAGETATVTFGATAAVPRGPQRTPFRPPPPPPPKPSATPPPVPPQPPQPPAPPAPPQPTAPPQPKAPDIFDVP